MTKTPELDRTLWAATANPAPETPALAGPLAVDVAVIGGGFTGMTAALHLARRGVKVAVFEAAQIGSGASGLNAGFVVPTFARADPDTTRRKLGDERGSRLLEMVGQGADRVFSTVRDLGIACDAEQNGWMHVAHDATGLAGLAQQADSWQALARPVRMLDAAEAGRLAGLRFTAGALLNESGGMLHPLNYLYGLTDAAQAAGARVHAHSPVASVEQKLAGWALSVNGRTITAGKVLQCSHAGSIGAAKRMSKITVPLFVYQIATEPMPAELIAQISPRRIPVADTRANLFTCRLDRDNRLISGAMAMLPVGAHKRMARMVVRRIAEELSLPKVPEVDFAWRGTAAMTTDFLPHLYEFGPGHIGGIGCNGRGIALTAMLGEVLADAATGSRLADLPVPLANPTAIPFHGLAPLASSAAIGQARFLDRKLTRAAG